MQLVTLERVQDEAGTDFEHLEFGQPGNLRIGAVLASGRRAGDIVDLNRTLAVRLGLGETGAPEAEADSRIPPRMEDWLRTGRAGLDEARAILDWVGLALERYEVPDLDTARAVVPRRAARLRAPLPRPGKILCVARNYLAHARERGQSDAPVEPSLFLKAGTCVAGPGDAITLPDATRQVDYEGELAVVIGRPAREVPVETALDHVAGYTCANDLSARDFQKVRGQSFIGKSCDGFAPMGPVLVTRDELPEPQKLRLTTTVSGERRQDGSTAEMIFGVAEIIAFASKLMTLEPGDVILTGTPAGVGAAADPPRWLAHGDVVEVEIEGIGCLRNTMRRNSS
jgi:2-keto-4-pentenoate hydratase/2-oxohepta-3-ene-1,7-dioic acid hydratase in catechol pathway